MTMTATTVVRARSTTYKTSSATIYESHYETVRLWSASFCIFFYVFVCASPTSQHSYNPHIVAHHIQCYCGIMKMDGPSKWRHIFIYCSVGDEHHPSSSPCPYMNVDQFIFAQYLTFLSRWSFVCAHFGLESCCVLSISAAFSPAAPKHYTLHSK